MNPSSSSRCCCITNGLCRRRHHQCRRRRRRLPRPHRLRRRRLCRQLRRHRRRRHLCRRHRRRFYLRPPPLASLAPTHGRRAMQPCNAPPSIRMAMSSSLSMMVAMRAHGASSTRLSARRTTSSPPCMLTGRHRVTARAVAHRGARRVCGSAAASTIPGSTIAPTATSPPVQLVPVGRALGTPSTPRPPS